MTWKRPEAGFGVIVLASTPSSWGKGELTVCNVNTLLEPVFLSWPLPASALVSSSSLWQVLQDVGQCPWPPRVTCQ